MLRDILHFFFNSDDACRRLDITQRIGNIHFPDDRILRTDHVPFGNIPEHLITGVMRKPVERLNDFPALPDRDDLTLDSCARSYIGMKIDIRRSGSALEAMGFERL